MWKGQLNGQVGYFKTALVEEFENFRTRSGSTSSTSRPAKRYGITPQIEAQPPPTSWLNRPGAFREMLIKFDLTHLTQVFRFILRFEILF